jgi:ABC-type uncharacterized transport system YnjBCD permease subunit
MRLVGKCWGDLLWVCSAVKVMAILKSLWRKVKANLEKISNFLGQTKDLQLLLFSLIGILKRLDLNGCENALKYIGISTVVNNLVQLHTSGERFLARFN